MEFILSRIIQTQTAAKERTQMLRAVVLAVRELALQSEPNQTAVDAAAFLALALENIYSTVDASVAAWEKRGYWVKADRFRMDWDWTRRYGEAMRKGVLDGDWASIAVNMAEIFSRVSNVKVPKRHNLGIPWTGAYQRLLEETDQTV
jgi:hypothetical protein